LAAGDGASPYFLHPSEGTESALPDLFAGFKAAYFKAPTSKGRGWGAETKMMYAPGDRNPCAATVRLLLLLFQMLIFKVLFIYSQMMLRYSVTYYVLVTNRDYKVE